MYKKTGSYLLLSLIFLQGCQSSQEKELFLNPPSTKTYTFNSQPDGSPEFKSKSILKFEKVDNQIKVITTMIEHLYGDAVQDAEFNQELQKDVNIPEINTYNKYGKPISLDGDKNPLGRLLIIEFPEHKLKEGDTWTGRKSAEPGFPFKTILTKYRLESISENMNKIDVEMIFELDKNVDDAMKSMNTSYSGYYVVNDDGTVKVANLTTNESTPFSSQTGQIHIKEVK